MAWRGPVGECRDGSNYTSGSSAMRTEPRRILIVRPSALGDVVRSVPLLWSLKGAFPTAKIDWIVEDRWADAVRGHPALDSVIEFPKRRFRAVAWNPVVASEALRWFLLLSKGKYDLTIDAQGLARSALMSWMTRAPVRIAAEGAMEFAWVAANRRVAIDSAGHVVDGMLRLAQAAGAAPVADMRLVATPTAVAAWERRRTALGITPSYLVVAAANRWEGKRWQAAKWQETLMTLGSDLAGAGIHDVVWIGGKGEEGQVAQCIPRESQSAGVRHHALAGSTTVAETMAIIAGSALVLSVDSAPAHMSVGFSIPLVALYGASNPDTDGPYGQREWCLHGGAGTRLAPRSHRDPELGSAMMERITVQEVVAMVRRRLQGISAR